MLPNTPPSTVSPTGAFLSEQSGGAKAWLLGVSIRRSNGASTSKVTGAASKVALLVVEGIVKGAAVAFSALFRTSGLMVVTEKRSSDRGLGTKPSSTNTSWLREFWFESAKDD